MKKSKLFVVLVAAGFAINMQAQRSYESFDYELGGTPTASDQDDLNGWSTGWIKPYNEDIISIAEGINYNGVTTKGNALIIDDFTTGKFGMITRELTADAFPDEAGKVYWWSFLMMTKTDVTDTYGGLFINDLVGENNTGQFNMCLLWSPTYWGADFGSSGGQKTSDALIVQDEPVLCVARIEMSGDDQPEQAYVWFNPDVKLDELDPATANLDGTPTLNNGITTINAYLYNATVVFDEIVIGTSWADVNLYKGQGIPKTLTADSPLSCTPSLVSASATVSYRLSANQQVKVSLFNTLGEEVAVLAEGNQAAGTHETVFSADNLNDGIYLCKLQAGKETAVTQIIVKK